MTVWREGYSGTGTGAFTPDGCSVEFYSLLPVQREPEFIARAVPGGASILELGSGVGRVTHALVERGYAVTAVDESAEMLARVRGARTVRSTIEGLDLPDRFDAVLLGSCLVHAPDARPLLRACARHVKPGGVVVIQREGLDWYDQVPSERPMPHGVMRLVRADEAEPGIRSVTLEYALPEGTWTQTFRSRELTEAAFEELLASAGLTGVTYLNDERTWISCHAGIAREPGTHAR